MENNEIAANGMISENTENTENTENKCAEKTNGVAGPGRNAYDVLNERGFLKQCSHPEELRELLGKEKLTFYIGLIPRRKVSPSVTMLQCALWRICRNAGIIPSCFSAEARQ